MKTKNNCDFCNRYLSQAPVTENFPFRRNFFRKQCEIYASEPFRLFINQERTAKSSQIRLFSTTPPQQLRNLGAPKRQMKTLLCFYETVGPDYFHKQEQSGHITHKLYVFGGDRPQQYPNQNHMSFQNWVQPTCV